MTPRRHRHDDPPSPPNLNLSLIVLHVTAVRASGQAHIVSRIRQDEAQALVRSTDDECGGRIQQCMLQEHHRPPAPPELRHAHAAASEIPLPRAAGQASQWSCGHTTSGATGRHALALRHHAEHVRLCAPVCMGRADVAYPRARQPVDAEQVAVSGLHCVLLQRVALRVHQRCMQQVALSLHSMLALPSAGRNRRTPPRGKEVRARHGWECGVHRLGKGAVARRAVRRAHGQQHCCSQQRMQHPCRYRRPAAGAWLQPSSAFAAPGNNLVCRGRTGACCTGAVLWS